MNLDRAVSSAVKSPKVARALLKLNAEAIRRLTPAAPKKSKPRWGSCVRALERRRS